MQKPRNHVLSGLLAWVMSSASATALADGPGDVVAARGHVFLITDYGYDDFYVGALKGAVLQKNPGAALHDLTHNLPAFDVDASAFILAQATATLPAHGTVVTVVDPGVGTQRRSIGVRTKRGMTYVAPDNGLLTHVIREQGLVEARELTLAEAMSPLARSSTFHGRDIYGPVGGWLSAGGDFSRLGPAVKDVVMLPSAEPTRRGNAIVGKVVLVDRYGNLLTNIPGAMLPHGQTQSATLQVMFGETYLRAPMGRTYASVPAGQPVVVINSIGLLEIAINQDSAGRRYAVQHGATVEITPESAAR
jgi:S-adenosylmethionine hydrolase